MERKVLEITDVDRQQLHEMGVSYDEPWQEPVDPFEIELDEWMTRALRAEERVYSRHSATLVLAVLNLIGWALAVWIWMAK